MTRDLDRELLSIDRPLAFGFACAGLLFAGMGVAAWMGWA